MSQKFDCDQEKVNILKISTRNLIPDKVKADILTKLTECVLTAIPLLDRDFIYTILLKTTREWEIEEKQRLNNFKFIHVNERMKAFDKIFDFFIASLNDLLFEALDEQTANFLRKATLTNYKDVLEAEGYVVSFQF